jgi:hypothetical protein
LFGILLLVYVPALDPYPGYTPIGNETVTDAAYDELPEGELICPERRANLWSSTYININEMLIPSVGICSVLSENAFIVYV